jgi:hypothetical protein
LPHLTIVRRVVELHVTCAAMEYQCKSVERSLRTLINYAPSSTLRSSSRGRAPSPSLHPHKRSHNLTSRSRDHRRRKMTQNMRDALKGQGGTSSSSRLCGHFFTFRIVAFHSLTYSREHISNRRPPMHIHHHRRLGHGQGGDDHFGVP